MFRKKTIQRWKKYIGNLFRIPTNGNSYELILPNGKVKRYPRIPGLKVAFHGVNSKVRIYAPARFENSKIILNDNSECIIGSTGRRLRIRNLNVIRASNLSLTIGEGTSISGMTVNAFDKHDATIQIGKHCMFSYDINIFTSDGHTIYEQETGKITNRQPCKIIVEDHVWIGWHVTLLKNAAIASDSIVGATSLVTGEFKEPNSLIAGIPAKLIRRGINWDRTSVTEFGEYRDPERSRYKDE